MVLQLVRDTSAFMDRKVGQPTLRWEVLTVLVIGALGSIGLAYVGQQIMTTYDASETMRFPMAGLALTPVFGAGVLWLWYTFGIHLLANRVYGSRTPIRRILKATPWAMIPLGIANLARSGLLYLVVQDVDIATVIEEGDTFGLFDPIDLVMQAILTDTLFLLSPVIMILAIGLMGYLLVYAVQSAKNISRPEAARVVALLASVHVLYILWELAQAYGYL